MKFEPRQVEKDEKGGTNTTTRAAGLAATDASAAFRARVVVAVDVGGGGGGGGRHGFFSRSLSLSFPFSLSFLVFWFSGWFLFGGFLAEWMRFWCDCRRRRMGFSLL